MTEYTEHIGDKEVDFINKQFYKIHFKQNKFVHNITNCRFTDCKFGTTRMPIFENVTIENVYFYHINNTNDAYFYFKKVKFIKVTFELCYLQNSYFIESSFSKVKFLGGDLTGTTFSKVKVNECEFKNTILTD